MQKTLAAALIAVLIVSSFGCASAGRHVTRYPKNQTLSEARFDPDYVYEIKMKGTEARYRAEGGSLEKRESGVAIRTESGFSEIPAERIERITASSKEPTGSHALLGMGIGAGTLALLAGLVAGVGNCDDSGDPGDCEGLRTLGLAIGIPGGALVGGAIGAGIGALIPKKAKTTITPLISHSGTDTRAGVGVGVAF
ncbi:MAG TPA: hypothetical protein VFX30_06180 [bacterium]|nr:hypothetical protein [bacterium]